MIAPWCEAEAADGQVRDLGLEALSFWTRDVPVATRARAVSSWRRPATCRTCGASPRRTDHHETLDADALATLEPDLAGRFTSALYFSDEMHLEPRRAVAALGEALGALPNVTIRYDVVAPAHADNDCDWTIDARGLAARDRLPDLRGVKGEMVVLHTRDVRLARPVRLVHPRTPMYVVPRPDGLFMVGATMIENEEPGRVTGARHAGTAGRGPMCCTRHLPRRRSSRPAATCGRRFATTSRASCARGATASHQRACSGMASCWRRPWRDRPPTRYSEHWRSRMQICVNGTPLQVKATTLSRLLADLDYDGAAVATAVNRTFVRRADRDATQLHDNDEIEILTPRQGG